MLKDTDIIADMHTHTVASQHAYSTIEENINYAKQNGIKYIAITDHFHVLNDHLFKMNEMSRIKYMEANVNKYSDIKIIGSAEFNILQKTSSLEKLKFLKWKPIGLHSHYIENISSVTYETLYNAFAEASDYFNAFCHIERELDKIKKSDSEENEIYEFMTQIVHLAKEKNIYLELNVHSLEGKNDNIDRIRFWMAEAKRNRNLITLGTDAHFCREVGHFHKAVELLNELDYDRSLILNCDETAVKALINRY